MVVSDGVITRGWDAVRNAAPIAVFPFVMTMQTAQGPAQMRAAMTLILEKGPQGWKIIHDHTSTAAPEGQ